MDWTWEFTIDHAPQIITLLELFPTTNIRSPALFCRLTGTKAFAMQILVHLSNNTLV